MNKVTADLVILVIIIAALMNILVHLDTVHVTAILILEMNTALVLQLVDQEAVAKSLIIGHNLRITTSAAAKLVSCKI